MEHDRRNELCTCIPHAMFYVGVTCLAERLDKETSACLSAAGQDKQSQCVVAVESPMFRLLSPVAVRRPTSRYIASGPSALNIESTRCNVTQCPRIPLISIPCHHSINAIAGHRTVSVGDRCVCKKRHCMAFPIYVRKHMFSHFRSHR